MNQIPFWVYPLFLGGTIVTAGFIWALCKISGSSEAEEFHIKADSFHPCVEESLLNIR